MCIHFQVVSYKWRDIIHHILSHGTIAPFDAFQPEHDVRDHLIKINLISLPPYYINPHTTTPS